MMSMLVQNPSAESTVADSNRRAFFGHVKVAAFPVLFSATSTIVDETDTVHNQHLAAVLPGRYVIDVVACEDCIGKFDVN